MDLKDPGHQVDDAEQARRMDVLSSQVHQAAQQDAEVVYVPEMAFGFDPQETYTTELQALTAETNTYLYFTYAHHDDLGWHNETVLISPDGTFSPVYGKQHAFGEPRTITTGEFPIHETPYGRLGSIICMDGVFTDSARNTARAVDVVHRRGPARRHRRRRPPRAADDGGGQLRLRHRRSGRRAAVLPVRRGADRPEPRRRARRGAQGGADEPQERGRLHQGARDRRCALAGDLTGRAAVLG